MDVNMLNRNQEYLKNYSNSNNSSQYVDAQSQQAATNIIKASVVDKSNESNNNNDQQKKNKQDFTKEDLDKALKKINKFLEDDKTHAEYEKHKELGTMMIKIVDEETDKVILEVPPKKILDMVAVMCEQVGILDKKA